MAARPATRHIRERPAEATQPRPAVRDLSRGPASFRIDWDVRPAFDFVFSLSGDAGATDDLPAEDRAWLTSRRRRCRRRSRRGSSGCSSPRSCIHVPVVAVDRPEIRTGGGRRRSASTGRSYKEVLLGHVRRMARDEQPLTALVERALDGDKAVLPAIAESLPEWKRDARIEILREPEQSVAGPGDGPRLVGRRRSRRSRPGSRTSSSATTSSGRRTARRSHPST